MSCIIVIFNVLANVTPAGLIQKSELSNTKITGNPINQSVILSWRQ